VERLNVNLIRFADGTTTLERLQKKLAQTSQTKEKTARRAKPERPVLRSASTTRG